MLLTNATTRTRRPSRSTPSGGAVARRRKAFRWAEGYAYVGPAVLVFALFFLVPVFIAIDLSFRSWDGLSPLRSAPWIGIDNYVTLFGDDVFHDALSHTLVITIACTVVQTSIAFVLAYCLWYYSQRFSAFQRSVIFFPTILAMVLVGLLWKNLLALEGPVNEILGIRVSWLSDPDIVLWVVVWMNLWQFTGWSMVIFYAALVSVPRELLEAARLDGVGDIRMAKSIVGPLVGHATALVVLLNIIGAAQTFDTVWVTTRGGPAHSTETLTTYAYWTALDGSGPGQFGLAAAASCVIIASLMVVAVVRIRLIKSVTE